MMNKQRLAILSVLGLVVMSVCISSRPAKVTAQNSSHDPTWWSKYEFIRDNGSDASPLSTTSTTATGMIVFALEDVHVGDAVELDEQQ